MEIPADKKIFEGEIATYWFDDGILVSLSKSTKRTVENITGNIPLVKSITNDKRVPVLIYLSSSPVPIRQPKDFRQSNCPMFTVPWPWFQRVGLQSLL